MYLFSSDISSTADQIIGGVLELTPELNQPFKLTQHYITRGQQTVSNTSNTANLYVLQHNFYIFVVHDRPDSIVSIDGSYPSTC